MNHSIPHGIAVVRGLDLASFVSCRRGWLAKDSYERVHKVCEKITKGADFSFFDVKKCFQPLNMIKKQRLEASILYTCTNLVT